ncbi:MAG: transglutaminase family protein [Planctomycetales bacterium]|nr:transglutaminase family protein [Planctomycetales bacterium]
MEERRQMQIDTDVDARLKEALRIHDRLVAETGIDLWLGAEPTFTDRHSNDPHWQTTALGCGKEAKARQFACRIANQTPGCVILRTLGRQYPGESTPRWNFGIFSRRDGRPVWSGPTDPMVVHQINGTGCTTADSERDRTEELLRDGASDIDEVGVKELADRLRLQLAKDLIGAGFAVEMNLPDASWGVRLLFADDSERLQSDWESDPAVTRPPIQSQAIPVTGATDELAARGVFLVSIGLAESSYIEDQASIQVELPDFDHFEHWQILMDLLGTAANRCGVPSMILTGFPPPVSKKVSFTTVTPDPGVIEVNMAPCRDLVSFYQVQQQLHYAANEIGVSSYKLLFNGEVVDSGGGQHLTFGGPTAESSPFFQRPRLLPSLVAYLNRHPALSYWFAVRSVGSCGQQPRSDEVSPESFDGLAVSLDRLFIVGRMEPGLIWSSLRQFLCDRFGNTHRCEVNIEKLWNVNSPTRGCLGLVELRAFRMTRTAEDAAAIAALMRTLVAWLSTRVDEIKLVEWGSRLHDRFSLPYYLLRDLDTVIAELNAGGFVIEDPIAERLTDDAPIVIGKHDLGPATIKIRQAIEFWPVIGSENGEEGTFRMMDSSTQRVELMLELPESTRVSDHADWSLEIRGFDVPWVVEEEPRQVVLLRGVRYKTFDSETTVTPLVKAIDPMEFIVTNRSMHRSWRIRLYNWEPNQLPYDGLPSDLEVAQNRREERVLVDEIDEVPIGKPIRTSAITEHCVDLRRV